MVTMRVTAMAAALATLVALPACSGVGAAKGWCSDAPEGRVAVGITSAKGRHCFAAERAATSEQQARGLMFRTDLGPESAMLFHPYPPEGPPRAASFWMKNTPTALDIIFIRADGTIANIAEDTVPFSEDPVPSEGPVAAVLEIVAGRSTQLGIAPGDKVSLPPTPAPE